MLLKIPSNFFAVFAEFFQKFSKITPQIPGNVFKITSYFERMERTTGNELNTANRTNMQNMCLFGLFVHTLFVWFIQNIWLQVNTAGLCKTKFWEEINIQCN